MALKHGKSSIYDKQIMGCSSFAWGPKNGSFKIGSVYAFNRNAWSDCEGKLGLAGTYWMYGKITKTTKTTVSLVVCGYSPNDYPIFNEGEDWCEDGYRAIDNRIGESRTIKSWNKVRELVEKNVLVKSSITV